MNEPIRDSKGLQIVLMADDDEDDRFLMGNAFRTALCKHELRFVKDGEELMEYLLGRGKFADPEFAPRPSLILLDLNMPKRDGREILPTIKTDQKLMDIPIVIWTTSDLEEDRILCQTAGADAFLNKPDNYEDLEKAVRKLCEEWLA